MDDLPLVSIVIPARNASKYLASCLESINELDYPNSKFEVIVADNGSTDDTANIARELGALVVDAPGVRVGGVRNRGAGVAKGSIFAFTDSDILVGPLWISTAVRALQYDNIGAVGGGCRSPEHGTWVEKAWTTRVMRNSCCIDHLAGSSFILKRELFERLDGFNEDLIAAEDDDLSQRVRANKLKLMAEPNCCVVHLGYPKTLIDVARRQIWHGSSVKISFNRINDTMNLLTYLFLIVSLMILPLALISFINISYLLADIFIIFFIPFIIAIKKTMKGNEYYARLIHFMMLWLIYLYYFAGKSTGIIKRLFNQGWGVRNRGQCLKK